jgi:hypothetical protein
VGLVPVAAGNHHDPDPLAPFQPGGKNLSNALETRAFSASVKKRTYYSDIAMRPGDFVFLGITLAAAGFFLLYKP